MNQLGTNKLTLLCPIWIYDNFGNNLLIKHNFSNFLMNYWLVSDKRIFPLKYFMKKSVFIEIFSKWSGLKWISRQFIKMPFLSKILNLWQKIFFLLFAWHETTYTYNTCAPPPPPKKKSWKCWGYLYDISIHISVEVNWTLNQGLSQDPSCLSFGQAVSRKSPFWTGKTFQKEFSILTFWG